MNKAILIFALASFIGSATGFVLSPSSRLCWGAVQEAFHRGRIDYAQHLADVGPFCGDQNGARFPARYVINLEENHVLALQCMSEDRP